MIKSRFVYLRPARLLYLRTTGPYASSIPEAWQRLHEWMQQHGVEPQGRYYGLRRDDPSEIAPDLLRYDACIELPPGLENVELLGGRIQRLPAGAFMRRKFVGCYREVGDAALPLCNLIAATPGLRLAVERPLVVIYWSDPRNTDTPNLKAEVCAPVATRFETTKAA